MENNGTVVVQTNARRGSTTTEVTLNQTNGSQVVTAVLSQGVLNNF